ncbi:MAG: TonB-dependent receptor plug domain-containing protein [Prolixibacteraceae bacterium]|nr:TonB-dependent receptor plug domain-containing protein [Prolixibacteraceae bacterium]
MRHLLFVILVLAPTLFLWAEEPEPYAVYDSIFLEDVNVYADYNKYQAGAKIESLSTEQIESVQEGGIEQLLMRFTPIYIKSNAGGLATIHIRGTAPDHTSIMFGGINVNSLTLGHSDLSNITSFLFDKIDIQYGSSSAINGSGAIGGAIYLGKQNYWTNGVRVNAKYAHGSFGENMYGAKVYVGNGKWELATKLMQYKNANNFTYMNYSGFGNENGTKNTQHGAAINNKAIIQEVNYMFGSNEFFKSSLWYENSWHEIQPNIYGNTETVSELKDDNIRIWGEYKNENNLIKLAAGAGYVNDKEIYNNDQNQYIKTQRFITNIGIKHPIGKKIEYKAGIKYKYIVPNVYSYSDSAKISEHHADLYLTWFFQTTKRLKTTLNLRQKLVSNYDVPFTPALGAEYNLVQKNNHHLNALLNLSRSYRVPTLNDRYWPTSQNPLGTPDIKSESGFSTDLGLKHKHMGENFSSVIKINYFYLNIENWIEWRNINGPIPVNLDQVISQGFELHANASLKYEKLKTTLMANYTYNPSIKKENDKPDQQLLYIPRNMFNINLFVTYNNLSLLIDGSFTGERYYNYISKPTQIRKSLESYFLTNCMLKYNFKINKQSFIASFSANNIFDISYQNQHNYAMPGINFKASITTNLQFTNNK